MGENYICEGLGFFVVDFNGDDLIDIYFCDCKILSIIFKDLLFLCIFVNVFSMIENFVLWIIYLNLVYDSIFVCGIIFEKFLVMIMDM